MQTTYTSRSLIPAQFRADRTESRNFFGSHYYRKESTVLRERLLGRAKATNIVTVAEVRKAFGL